jgi:hypothetical protein
MEIEGLPNPEGEEAKDIHLSKTCPPKLHSKEDGVSLRDLDEANKVSPKTLKQRESPNKK